MGPLQGVQVVEVAGAGPTPFAGMLLADMGADVVRIDRVVDRVVGEINADTLMGRGKRSIAVDLKRAEGVEVLLRLADHGDVLIEGFRPGVAERLGFGPDVCAARNPRLVYARATGWGQDGPRAARAGHDIDYIAMAGALHPVGPPDRPPVPPLNLVGDFGGGGMLVVVGVLAALVEASRSGQGQVVDAAMVDGAALLTTVLHELRSQGLWRDERGANLVDGGAPFYATYETADGGYVAVGAMEPEFYAELLRLTGLDGEELPDQHDRAGWPLLRTRLAEAFRSAPRDEWERRVAGADGCVVPVLTMAEAPTHPDNVARDVFVDVDGTCQPAPAPRFSRTPSRVAPPPRRGQHSDDVLTSWGFGAGEIERLVTTGVVTQA